MEPLLIAIVTGAALGVILFVLWWFFLRDEKYTGEVNFVGDLSSLNQLARSANARRSLQNQMPGELDPVFYPPPAIDPRLQSVQYEHTLNPDINFDVDYQRQNDFPVVSPLADTTEAYTNATKQQIVSMKNLLHGKFDWAAKNAGISSISFDSVFRNLTLPVWKPSQVRGDILTQFLRKLSDDMFNNLQALFYAKNVKISSMGVVTPFNAQSSSSIAQIGFPNKSNFTVDDDQLVGGRSSAKSIDMYTQSQLRNTANKFVDSTYDELIEKFQYELNDVPRSSYQARIGEIKDIGTEMVDEIFTKKVSAQQLDDFTENVKSSMQESLFEIMMDSGVDPMQFS